MPTCLVDGLRCSGAGIDRTHLANHPRHTCYYLSRFFIYLLGRSRTQNVRQNVIKLINVLGYIDIRFLCL
jgi:hypothetical protein